MSVQTSLRRKNDRGALAATGVLAASVAVSALGLLAATTPESRAAITPGLGCTTDPIPVCSGSTSSTSTTTGVGTSFAGAAQALSQFLASRPIRSFLDYYLDLNRTVTLQSGGAPATITTQTFVTFTINAPELFFGGDNAATCDGPPIQWPPGANCTVNPGALYFIQNPGSINVHTNIHTEIGATLAAESPLFGFVLGDFHTSFQSALLDQNWSFLDSLFAQMRGFGATGSAPGAGLGGQFASLGVADTNIANLAQVGPDGRARPSPWFVWVRPVGLLGTVDSSNERLGFRYDVAGVSGGLEYRWSRPWVAGATLGYAHTSLTQKITNDKGSIDSLQIGAYGGYRDPRTHVVVAALFQQNWISSQRFTAIAPATASYTAQAYSIGAEAGHKFPVMGAYVQPLASLVFTHVRQGGFSENGTTLLEIAGQSNSVNALKASLGVRVWRDFELFGTKLTPEFRARWVQDLLNERRAITARFVGDPAQTAFTVNGAKPTPAALIIGGGLTLGGGSSFKLSVAYDAEIRSNARNHTIQAQLKMRW